MFISALKNIRISQKLILICAALAVPMAVMLYLIVGQFNKDISKARIEQQGNAYLRPVEDLLELLPQQRFYALRTVKGDAAAKSELDKLILKIDDTFVQLVEQ